MKDTGGFAFPVNAENLGELGAYAPDPGMTLHDLFAGFAMVGLILMRWNIDKTFTMADYNDVADMADKFSDAMIVQRSKP